MIQFFDKTNINNLKSINLKSIDIYFNKYYGIACEYSDNALWELCKYKDLIYVYLKRPYFYNDITYYDLITPYGYSGYYFENDDTFDEFIDLFRKEAIKRNYITEVLRQNPYLNLNYDKIISNYGKIVCKKTLGVYLHKYNNLNDYIKKTNKNNRKCYNKARNNNLLFEVNNITKESLNNFLQIYNKTMEILNANHYYYFNKNYYDKLLDLNKNIKIANVYYNNKLIASCMIFVYGEYINYHIGGSLLDYRHLYPNNFLHCKVIEYGINNNFKYYHLGGGLNNDDNLYKFKLRLSDIQFNYNIYKNILNEKIYNDINNYIYKDTNNYITNDFFPLHLKN